MSLTGRTAITLDEFFRSGSGRMHEDFIGLYDRTWGWDDDYGRLAAAGREAIRAHPGTYPRDVVRDFGFLLRTPLYLGASESGADGAATAAPSEPETIVVNGRVFRSRQRTTSSPQRNSPASSRRLTAAFEEVWTSPTAHHLAFRDPADARRAPSSNGA